VKLRHPTPVVCPHCLAELRAQRTEYAFGMDLYFCLLHGRVITGQWLAMKLHPGSRS
jgi:hypothetical protein